MTSALLSLLTTGVESHAFPGAVGMIWRDKQIWSAAVGSLRGDGTQAVTEETIYDVASITKAIPTSTLARLLLKDDVFSPEQTLAVLLPEYQGEGREKITLHDLLDFRVRWKLTLSALKEKTAPDLWHTILTAQLDEAVPSAQRWYVNATSLLLGRIIEKHTNQSLAQLADDRIFSPLNMTRTTFSPQTGKVAPSEVDAWRGREIVSEVHDESAWILRELFTPGSAGLFSTAPDLLTFLRWQLDHFDPQLGGLGWEQRERWMSAAATNTTYGKTGFTGCCVLWDPAQKVAAVLLSNATYPQRPTNRVQLDTLRQKFCYLALTGSLPTSD